MGGKYSKVVKPYFPELKILEGKSIIEVRSKMLSVSKHLEKSGLYFLSKEDIVWAMAIPPVQMYQIISMFDHSHNGNISSLDFWGALGLLSSDGNEDKINFCFKLMDLNHDEFLNYNDLFVVMMCVTRGVAKVRGYAEMPAEFIEKMIIEAFRVSKQHLNENGEISLADIRAVLLSDELVSQYMANLGVPVVEVDAAALVAKRSNLLKEAIALRAKMSETMCEIEDLNELANQRNERGGDAALLRITHMSKQEQQQHFHELKQQELQLKEQQEQERTVTKRIEKPAYQATADVVQAMRASKSNTAPPPPLAGAAAAAEGGGGGITSKVPAANTSSSSAGAGSAGGNAAAAINMIKAKTASAAMVTEKEYKPSPFTVDFVDAEHPARKYLKPDVSLFSDADMTLDGKSSRNIYGEGFRNALREVWCKLPQDEDLMVELDPYTIMALFDNVGALISYSDAQDALLFMPKSSINKYHFEDLLRWYIIRGEDNAVKRRDREVTQWNDFTDRMRDNYDACAKAFSRFFETVAYQRFLLDSVDDLSEKKNLKYINYLRPPRVSANSTGAAKEMSFMMKLVEFRKLTSKKSSNVNLKYVFGHPEARPLPASMQGPETDSNGDEVRSSSRGRSRSRGGGGSRSRSRSRNRGSSGGGGGGGAARALEDAEEEEEQQEEEVEGGQKRPGSSASGQSSRPGSSRGGPKVSPAEMKPKFKTVRLEEIEDWKAHLKFTVSANPFTNLSTKRPRDSSRMRSQGGRDYIDDFGNLHSQDFLDYYNLLQERLVNEAWEAELAALAQFEADKARLVQQQQDVAAGEDVPSTSRRSRASTPAAPAAPPKVKPKPTEYNSVMWFCISLRKNLLPEQERLFAKIVENYFRTMPHNITRHFYSEVFVKVFSVFITEGGKAQSDKVASLFVNSLNANTKGGSAKDDIAEAEIAFLSAPKVILVGLFHESDHFLDIEQKLVESDIFFTRAISNACLEVHLMQSFSDLYEHAQEFDHYGEKLFGPQEEELGEDGMNPLKFAKEVRRRRRYAHEMSVQAAEMPRADLVMHCRELGLNHLGSLGDLQKRVQEAYEQEVDLIGFGELSNFGEEVIAKMFHLFKKDPIKKSEEDGGLNLWEFNRLLASFGAPTLYDKAEYKKLMKELQLLVDKEQRLRLRGLQAYYRRSGRLKQENDAIGIGSLNEKMSGKFSFMASYESDAVGSILNLIGMNSVYVPDIIRQLTFFSTMKEVKMEAELERLSEFFDVFDLPIGKYINKEVLCNPGWLSRVWNSLCAFIGDGQEGLLPALRGYLHRHFGKYDTWEDVLEEGIVQRIRFDQEHDEQLKNLRASEQEQNLRIVRRDAILAERAAKEQFLESQSVKSGSTKTMSVRDAPNKLMRGGDGGGSSVGGFSQEADEEDEDVDFEEVDYAGKIHDRMRELESNVFATDLPALPLNNISLPDLIMELKEDLKFLHEVRFKKDVELSLEESSAIYQRKDVLVKKIEEVSQLIEEQEKLFAAHTCAFYDAFRMFAGGLSSIGLGGRDFCARVYASGVDFGPYLPKGMGEFCPTKQKRTEKIERAQKRKAAALAALERERVRRNMTEEEKELLRQELYAQQLREWAQEEATQFSEAYAALAEAREERKSVAEVTEMVQKWEALVQLKETRYPEDLGTAVLQNNLACILLEFFGPDHPRGQAGPYLFEAAVKIIDIVVTELESDSAHHMDKFLKSRPDVDVADEEETNDPAGVAGVGDRSLSSKGSSKSKKQKKRRGSGATGTSGSSKASASSKSTRKSSKPDGPSASAAVVNASATTSPAVAALPPPLQGETGEGIEHLEEEEQEEEVDDQEEEEEEEELAGQLVIGPSILIMLNFVSDLLLSESTGKLKQSFEVMRKIYDLYHLLPEKEKGKVRQGIAPQVNEMPVFPFKELEAALQHVEKEVSLYVEVAAKRALEAEAADGDLEEEDSSLASAMLESVDARSLTKQQRKEKRNRQLERRRADALKRAEVTRQRKLLYDLIQTDRITTIFNARAQGAQAADAPGWGEQNEAEMMALQSGMDALTATLNASSIDRMNKDSGKDPSLAPTSPGGNDADAATVDSVARD